jgi:predicted ArsR family transcriptional regulator
VNATQTPSRRPSLRDAAQRVLAAWEDEVGKRAELPDAIAALRTLLVKPAPAPRATGLRKPREGTKQQQVLAMLHRTEGASVAQIAEATGWQAHTIRGFFAGLKKRQGIVVEPAERVRQVGPGKEGAKGSYTVYRVRRAG